MNSPTDCLDDHRPSPSNLSAAEVEDRLLDGLAAEVRSAREQMPVLVRRIDRLQRLLARRHAAMDQLRGELARLSRLEGFDPLTGLPNRRGFEQPMTRMLSLQAGRPHALALLFVDLDGFKDINDRLGHAAGDALLKIVAARLAAGIRRGDLVCRHGGDEFVCLLPDLESEDRAQALAAGLLHAITQPCALDGRQVRIGASIGVATYPRDGTSFPALLRSADGAMYAAKRRRCGVAMARPGLFQG